LIIFLADFLDLSSVNPCPNIGRTIFEFDAIRLASV
jgi:hypothetical protein